MRIPQGLLSADALRGVIEAFVTREGTDYGMQDVPLTTKVAQVQGQLPPRHRGDRVRRRHRQLHDSADGSTRGSCLTAGVSPGHGRLWGLGMWGGKVHSGLLTHGAALCGQVASTVAVACQRGGSLTGKPAVSEEAGAWAHCQ